MLGRTGGSVAVASIGVTRVSHECYFIIIENRQVRDT